MKPTIFIGSSVEGKNIADALQVNLHYDARCTVWNQAFTLAQTTIDTLLSKFADFDFSVFVFSNDDILNMRNLQHTVARDNVVFESGLFMGMHGKDCCFLVLPQNLSGFHMPTDLLGVTTATYDVSWAKTAPVAALGAAATLIKNAIQVSTWANLRMSISQRSSFSTSSTITYPLKLEFEITNPFPFSVFTESLDFEIDPGLRFAPNASQIPGTNKYRPKYLNGKDANQKDIYVERRIIAPMEKVISWVPIDPSIGQTALDTAIKNRAVGIWRYSCYWLSKLPVRRDYEDNF